MKVTTIFGFISGELTCEFGETLMMKNVAQEHDNMAGLSSSVICIS